MAAKPLNIGLCGAHRTGKTTLAETISNRTGIPFVRTTTGEIMKRHGVNPAAPMDFSTRLDVQNRILEAYEELFSAQTREFITDRTPIDLMAYTLADISGTTAVNYRALDLYVARCFELSNSVFETLIIVQPGIPLVHAEGKAPLHTSYIEHLNTLILGLCHDERNTSNVFIFKRSATSLEQRARMIIESWCWATIGREAEDQLCTAAITQQPGVG